MTCIREIDFFGDEVLRKQLFRLSMVLLVPLVVLGFYEGISAGLTDASLDGSLGSEGINPIIWIALLVVLSIVVLPIHELIHAMFFKVFNPEAHVIFGFKDAMLYAGCPGTVFTRNQMLVVLLAPTVVLSAAFAIATFATSLPMLCLSALFIHLSGCSGDILAARAVMREPVCTHCEDTNTGIRLLAE